MSALDVFDHYGFKARLQPAFLALLPLAIAVFAWSQPGAKWATALWTLLGSAGFTFFLANMARNRGKTIESELWKVWGGPPTTALLRHMGTGNPVLRERWHQQLTKITGLPLPTADQERNDPAKADEMYEAAVRLIIGKMRDKKAFPFVYRDLVNYGFCRNLFALRGLGIFCAAIGLCFSVGACFWTFLHGGNQYLPWGCSVACFGLLLWWCFTITQPWVKIPAINYAQHLLEGMENLGSSKAPRKAKQTPS